MGKISPRLTYAETPARCLHRKAYKTEPACRGAAGQHGRERARQPGTAPVQSCVCVCVYPGASILACIEPDRAAEEPRVSAHVDGAIQASQRCDIWVAAKPGGTVDWTRRHGPCKRLQRRRPFFFCALAVAFPPPRIGNPDCSAEHVVQHTPPATYLTGVEGTYERCTEVSR